MKQYRDDNKTLWLKCHFFNGVIIGYQERYDIGIKEKFSSMSGTVNTGILNCKLHWINGQRIGCLQYYKSQYFYNKLGKIFGEQIKWK